MKRRLSCEIDEYTKLSTDCILNNVDGLPYIGLDVSQWKNCVFVLFLYFNKIHSKWIFLHRFFQLWSIVQIFAATASLPLILSIIEGKQDLVTNTLLYFMMFIVPDSLDQNKMSYITIFQLFTFLCIFGFVISLYRIKKMKPFHPWQVCLSYIVAVELSKIMIFPNIIYTSRALVATIVGHYPLNFLFISGVIFIPSLATIIYLTSFFKLSYFGNTKLRRIPMVHPNNIQMYIIPFVGWGVFSISNKYFSCISMSIVCFLMSLYILYNGLYPLSFRGVIDATSIALFILLVFNGIMGVQIARNKVHAQYSYYILSGLVMALGGYFITKIVEIWIFKHYKKRLENVSKFEDLKIKSPKTFLKYLCVAYQSHSRFLLDGSMFEYANHTLKDITTNLNLLEVAMHLPLSTPNIHLPYETASSMTFNNTKLQYYLFEYETVRNWRQQGTNIFVSESIKKTNYLSKSFIRLAYSYASYIQQEGSKSAFIFGQALADFVDKMESHVQKFLLFYPTNIDVLHMASYFYEHCVRDINMQRKYKQQITLFNYFSEMRPNWRELKTMGNYPIDLDISDSYMEEYYRTNDTISDVSDTLMPNDIMFQETKGLMNGILLISLFLIIAFVSFLVLIFWTFTSSENDTVGLITMTSLFAHHVYEVSGMLLYGMQPAFNSEFTAADRAEIEKFLDEFSLTHNTVFVRYNLLFNSNQNINDSCAYLYDKPYFLSATVSGTPRFYSYDSMMRKIETSVRESFPHTGFNPNSKDFHLVVNMFANASGYFNKFLPDYHHCLEKSGQTTLSNFISISMKLFVVIVFATILTALTPVPVIYSLRKLSKTINKTKSSIDSYMMKNNLSMLYKPSNHYIFLWVFLCIITWPFMIVFWYTNIIMVTKIKVTTEAAIKGDVTDIAQMGLLGAALASLEIFGFKGPVPNLTLYKNIAAVSTLWIEKDNKWKYLNDTSDDSPFFEVVRIITQQLRGLEIVYDSEKNKQAREIFQSYLRPLFDQRVVNRTHDFNDTILRVNMMNGQLQAMYAMVILLIFYWIGTTIIYFNKAVFLTEFIIKIIPYLKKETNPQDSILIASSSESKLLLDVLGVPGAVIDENDKILFVNHEWMSVFIGSQTTFIGHKFSIFTGEDPDVEVFDTCKDFRIVSINRSARLHSIRNKICVMEKEYQRLKDSAMPITFSPKEDGTRKVICAAISIVCPNLQNEDIDIVRKFTDYLFNYIKKELEMYNDAKIFMWSYSDITVVFNLDDEDKLRLAAIQALHLVATCTRLIIESEDIFGLYCSACVMVGDVAGNYDGAKCRQWRMTNAITLSPAIVSLVIDYIGDMTYVLDDQVAVIILENEYFEMDEGEIENVY